LASGNPILHNSFRHLSEFKGTSTKRMLGLQVVKTVKMPVHYALTKRKLSILDKLTAKTTYGVWLWSNLFDAYNSKGSYSDRAKFYEQVKQKSRLPAAMVQCCFDTTAWMWTSYRSQLAKWKRRMRRAKGKWREKLLKRQPREPFSNGFARKIPVWFDYRIGSIEKSRIKLCRYVARVSTLRRGQKLTIPLNPAKYHLDLLSKGTLKSFQIVKRDGRYFIHVKVEYEVPDQPVYAVRGIDLGVKRSIASVTLRPNQPLRSSDFSIVRDGLKRDRLNRLNRRVAELQQAERWEPLKRIRHKRRHVAEYFDRLSARLIADTSKNCLVAIGYPKHIKYENYKGNGKAFLRRLLAHWSYGRVIHYIKEECAERGIRMEAPEELSSSMTCHHCGSRNTERINQSVIHCWNCELWYNADFNAAINIGSRFLAKPLTRKGAVDSPEAGDEQAREIVACKPRSPHPSGVGASHMGLYVGLSSCGMRLGEIDEPQEDWSNLGRCQKIGALSQLYRERFIGSSTFYISLSRC